MTVTAGDANVKTTAYNNTVATSMSVGADTVAYDNVVGKHIQTVVCSVLHLHFLNIEGNEYGYRL